MAKDHSYWLRTLDDWIVNWTVFDRVLDSAEPDPAHDLGHIRRVVNLALEIGDREGADLKVLVAAAYLHDVVNLAKDHPDRALASTKSAEVAGDILPELKFPEALIPAVLHAIKAHSFSADIEPLTIEARCLQDADRLDALGAIGIARCFVVTGQLGRAIMDEEDPLAVSRPLDDGAFALDHFPIKLFRIAETMRTATGLRIGRERVAFMEDFRKRLAAEARPENFAVPPEENPSSIFYRSPEAKKSGIFGPRSED